MPLRPRVGLWLAAVNEEGFNAAANAGGADKTPWTALALADKADETDLGVRGARSVCGSSGAGGESSRKLPAANAVAQPPLVEPAVTRGEVGGTVGLVEPDVPARAWPFGQALDTQQNRRIRAPPPPPSSPPPPPPPSSPASAPRSAASSPAADDDGCGSSPAPPTLIPWLPSPRAALSTSLHRPTVDASVTFEPVLSTRRSARRRGPRDASAAATAAARASPLLVGLTYTPPDAPGGVAASRQPQIRKRASLRDPPRESFDEVRTRSTLGTAHAHRNQHAIYARMYSNLRSRSPYMCAPSRTCGRSVAPCCLLPHHPPGPASSPFCRLP